MRKSHSIKSNFCERNVGMDNKLYKTEYVFHQVQQLNHPKFNLFTYVFIQSVTLSSTPSHTSSSTSSNTSVVKISKNPQIIVITLVRY